MLICLRVGLDQRQPTNGSSSHDNIHGFAETIYFAPFSIICFILAQASMPTRDHSLKTLQSKLIDFIVSSCP